MTRPPLDLIRLIDGIVAEFDADTIDEPYTSPATSSFETIADEWERFRLLVDALDHALSDPLAEGSADTLKRGEELTGHEAYRLSFWLTHIGDAIQRRSRSLPPAP